MHQDADPAALSCSLFSDVAEHNRLAATGWQHEQHRSMPGLIRLADFSDGLLLVWPERYSHWPSSSTADTRHDGNSSFAVLIASARLQAITPIRRGGRSSGGNATTV